MCHKGLLRARGVLLKQAHRRPRLGHAKHRGGEEIGLGLAGATSKLSFVWSALSSCLASGSWALGVESRPAPSSPPCPLPHPRGLWGITPQGKTCRRHWESVFGTT